MTRCYATCWLSVCLSLALTSLAASADYEWRYMEGEDFAAHAAGSTRNEGFTSWMGHPSGSKVGVILGPGGWVEYEITGLNVGPYYIFVRALAWNNRSLTDVLWDGQRLGQLSFPRQQTRLMWSNPVGLVSGPGDHRLRLVRQQDNKPEDAQYIDVILLTTDANYVPSNADQDFVSLVTPLPLMHLETEPGPVMIPPQPGEQVDRRGALELRDVRVEFLHIGANEMTVVLNSLINSVRRFRITAQLGRGEQAELLASLAGGTSQHLPLTVDANQTGQVPLKLKVFENDKQLIAGSYLVEVPNPIKIALDEYAYPLGREQATWKAEFAGTLEVVDEISLSVAMKPEDSTEWSARTELDAAFPAVQTAFDLTELPVGRYNVKARFTRRGQVMLEDDRDFVIFKLGALVQWEPVQKTEAVGDAVFLNGKPLLGRYLSHANASEKIRDQGFNVVAVWGGDNDPCRSIGAKLDACREAGMWGMAALFNNGYFLHDGNLDLDHIREAVVQFKDHPALLGWDLVDEPGVHKLSPEQVLAAANLIRSLDPNHIVWVNMCRPNLFADYLESQDLWTYDYYPIPGADPFSHKVFLSITDQKIRGRRPMGIFLQTYSPVGMRMPTPDELRCIAWLHVIHGYKWFGYYSYSENSPKYGQLKLNHDLWSFTRKLNSELRGFAPVLFAPGEFVPVEASVDWENFRAAIKDVAGERYLVAVSGSAEPATVRMKVGGQSATALFEAERSLPIQGGILEDRFRSWGVHVYNIQ